MRLFIKISDTSENYDYADVRISKELAAIILTARKKLIELRKTPGIPLDGLNCFRLYAMDKVQYFKEACMGEPEVLSEEDEKSPDLLTSEQREDLEHNEFIEVPDELQLHKPFSSSREIYASTSVDYLLVSEEGWWFESWLEGGYGPNFLETLTQNFNMLEKAL